jgi:POT family proton-dependent oligopeptide transporter
MWLTLCQGKLPPQGTVLPNAVKVIAFAIAASFDLNAADPSYQHHHFNRAVPWTSCFVEEIRRGLRAYRVILCFTIYYLCFNQSMTTIVSQANQMKLSGISNDTVQSFNAIAYVILNPLIQHCLFPFLSRRHISLGPIARMTVAFILMAIAMAYASGIQKLIYSRGPCFSHPLFCDAAIHIGEGDKIHRRPNNVSIWIQVPLHVLLAASEISGFVALNEFAYVEAPMNMKALVKAFEQFTAAVGAGLGIALAPISKDPLLVAMFAALAGTMFLSGVAFYTVFRAHDRSW